ncbi:T9SS type A sorting domain-containing protein [candidate division WOR-3 bacterium]|nr:T9SS type A sorting domain-containing protein [candidate division WOR-3 bacterium]
MSKKLILMVGTVLMLATALPINAQDVLLGPEGFEGLSHPNLPAGWDRIDNYGSSYYRYHWNAYGWGSNYQIGNQSAGCYYVWDFTYWNPSDYSDEWLLTPPINLSGYTSATLQFNAATYNYMYEYPSGGHSKDDFYATVQVSTDGGSTWDDAIFDFWKDYPGRTYIQDAPNPFILDLSDYAGEEIVIGFRAHADPVQAYMYAYSYRFFFVDNVTVTATSGGGPSGEIDLEMVQIIRPLQNEEGGIGFKPKCKVQNHADETVNAKVRVTITDLSNMQTVHEEVLNSYPFPPGYTDVTFDHECELEGNKMFDALFVVTHPEDENVENNDMTKRVTTEPGTQVDATTINAPSEDQLNSFIPDCTFEEKAGNPTTGNTHAAIVTTELDTVYQETNEGEAFDSLESRDITFPEVTGLEDGDYIITFWATDEEGGEIGAPAMRAFTYVSIAEEPVVSAFDLKVTANNVTFSLGTATEVNLRIYDAAGNLVSVLASGGYNAGTHTLNFDAPTNGVYFFKLVTPTWTAQKKAIVLH